MQHEYEKWKKVLLQLATLKKNINCTAVVYKTGTLRIVAKALAITHSLRIMFLNLCHVLHRRFCIFNDMQNLLYKTWHKFRSDAWSITILTPSFNKISSLGHPPYKKFKHTVFRTTISNILNTVIGDYMLQCTFSGLVFPSSNLYETIAPFFCLTLYSIHLFQTRFGRDVLTQNQV